MNGESERIERMRRYVEASYQGATVAAGRREGAAAIGREAMLREMDRHSWRHSDEAPQPERGDPQSPALAESRDTPWRIGMFRFGKGKENHEHHQE